ncbi:MAG: signal peptidase II [Defluviitaleaceae bacterium]|nr:signal peptidase II [Defluviitaleaceae bacterium]
MKKIIVLLLLIAIDLATKRIAANFLYPNGSFILIDGFFRFRYLENPGAAFGIFANSRIFLLALRAIIISYLVYYYSKLPNEKPHIYVKWAIIFILAGALGNFIDSLLFGYVIDFLEFTFVNFAIFNVADIFIVLGTIFWAYLSIFVLKEDKNEN